MPVLIVSPPLREQLGDEATDVLVDLFDQISDQTKEDVITVVGERFERRLAEELAVVRGEMARWQAELEKQIVGLGVELRKEMADLRVELRGEMADLRTEMADLRAELREEMAGLRTDLARGQTEMIRWMFLFWIGQLAAILAILFTFFRK